MSLGCEEEEEEEEEEEKKEVLFHAKMAASREPEDVIVSRGGSVLGKKTILKSDHFPGCQNKRLLPHVDGAPNYRQVDILRILLSICLLFVSGLFFLIAGLFSGIATLSVCLSDRSLPAVVSAVSCFSRQ